MANDKSGSARQFLKITGIQDILDMDITEIAINEPGRIWFEGAKGWEYKNTEKASYENLHHLAKLLCNFSGIQEEPGERSPINSVVLPDGERGQIILPPATKPGRVIVSIRKPSLKRFTLDDYVKSGRFDRVNIAQPQMVELSERQKYLYELSRGKGEKIATFIREAVNDRLNILMVGGTGSGKTTIAKAITDIFPPERRYVSIEDVPEMELTQPNHVPLFYKKGTVAAKAIIEACMRLKPDHIFLAELRGDEAWSYLEALNTGHEGSVSTIHANNAWVSFARLASLIKQSSVGMTIDMELIMKTIKTSIDVIMFFNHTYLTEIYYEPEVKNRLLSQC